VALGAQLKPPNTARVSAFWFGGSVRPRRRKTAREKSQDQEPRKRAHEEYPPGTPVPRGVLQVRLRDLHEELASIERPAFGHATTAMLAFLGLLVAAEIAFVDLVPSGMRWLFILFFGVVLLAARVPNRLFDQSDGDDARRAALLGDVAYFEAAQVADDAAIHRPPRPWWARRSPPMALGTRSA